MEDFCHDRLCAPCKGNAKSTITYAWFTALAFVLCAFIAACAAAARTENSDDSYQGLEFAAVWSALITVAMSIGGTIVVRRNPPAFVIGGFLGVTTIVSQQCFMISALFAAIASEKTEHDSSEKAVATFNFFLFVVYGLFAILLAVFRKDVIKENTAANEAASGQVPPRNY